jgi:hypothetical protein
MVLDQKVKYLRAGGHRGVGARRMVAVDRLGLVGHIRFIDRFQESYRSYKSIDTAAYTLPEPASLLAPRFLAPGSFDCFRMRHLL